MPRNSLAEDGTPDVARPSVYGIILEVPNVDSFLSAWAAGQAAHVSHEEVKLLVPHVAGLFYRKRRRLQERCQQIMSFFVRDLARFGGRLVWLVNRSTTSGISAGAERCP
jgi:hypothetical protein